MKLVSVIVPVYNVLPYLDKCIESCVNQTYKELQIILVDDGSTDGCGKRCDEWVERDSRIQVVHKENGGLSSARNAGLEVAVGAYIYFLDSDDYIHQFLIEDAVDAMTDDIDLVFLNYQMVDEEGIYKYASTFCPRKYTWDNDEERFQFLAKNFFNYEIGWEAWSRIFRKSIIDKYNLKFFDNRIIFAEDLYFSFCYLLHARAVTGVLPVRYYYLQRNSSIMGQQSQKLNIGRFNELSKAVSNYLSQQKGLEIFKERFAIFHYNIINNIFNTNPILKKCSVEQKYEKINLDVEDIDYFKKQFKSLNKLKKHLFQLWGVANTVRVLAETNYYVNGNITLWKVKNKIYHSRAITLWNLIDKKKWNDYREVSAIKSGVKGLYLIGTEDFGNIGDHQIAESIHAFFKKNFPDYYIFEVSASEYNYMYPKLKKVVRPADLIIMTGGGNLGSLYSFPEYIRESVITTWSKNPKIIFPQSIYYSNDEEGQERLKKDKELLSNSNNLILTVREKISYEFAANNFDCKILMVPDIVLSISPNRDNIRKNQVTFCMRNDTEKAISESEKNLLRRYCTDLCDKICECDTEVWNHLGRHSRKYYCEYFINLFASSKLVVTDRLHGMIFCAVIGTPCIALGSVYPKIKATYDLISYLPYIYFAENIEQVKSKMKEFYNMSECYYDVKPLNNMYDELVNLIAENL